MCIRIGIFPPMCYCVRCVSGSTRSRYSYCCWRHTRVQSRLRAMSQRLHKIPILILLLETQTSSVKTACDVLAAPQDPDTHTVAGDTHEFSQDCVRCLSGSTSSRCSYCCWRPTRVQSRLREISQLLHKLRMLILDWRPTRVPSRKILFSQTTSLPFLSFCIICTGNWRASITLPS